MRLSRSAHASATSTSNSPRSPSSRANGRTAAIRTPDHDSIRIGRQQAGGGDVRTPVPAEVSWPSCAARCTGAGTCAAVAELGRESLGGRDGAANSITNSLRPSRKQRCHVEPVRAVLVRGPADLEAVQQHRGDRVDVGDHRVVARPRTQVKSRRSGIARPYDRSRPASTRCHRRTDPGSRPPRAGRCAPRRARVAAHRRPARRSGPGWPGRVAGSNPTPPAVVSGVRLIGIYMKVIVTGAAQAR